MKAHTTKPMMAAAKHQARYVIPRSDGLMFMLMLLGLIGVAPYHISGIISTGFLGAELIESVKCINFDSPPERARKARRFHPVRGLQ